MLRRTPGLASAASRMASEAFKGWYPGWRCRPWRTRGLVENCRGSRGASGIAGSASGHRRRYGDGRKHQWPTREGESPWCLDPRPGTRGLGASGVHRGCGASGPCGTRFKNGAAEDQARHPSGGRRGGVRSPIRFCDKNRHGNGITRGSVSRAAAPGWPPPPPGPARSPPRGPTGPARRKASRRRGSGPTRPEGSR